MQIAILGLGLIGGSIAKALKANTAHTVIGLDRDENVLLDALSLGASSTIFVFSRTSSITCWGILCAKKTSPQFPKI